MPHEYDPGYGAEPFRTLCNNHPGAEVFPLTDFRIEWGPIFHRGRLDGSARVLAIGQDPAQHENIARRILVGEAGQRVQGFLFKLGVERSYVIINAFLYSAYAKFAPQHFKDNPQIIQYRNQWFDALIVGKTIEAVVAFGGLADDAWNKWKTTAAGQGVNIPYVHVPHPTFPESASLTTADKKAKTKQMLQQWNAGLTSLRAAITHPDSNRALELYGDEFKDSEKPEIPEFDLPPGTPPWMRGRKDWARRTGDTVAKKRANITVTVPAQFLP